METSIASTIAEDPQKVQLDNQCKIILSHKAILSRILEYTVSEVEGISTDEIIASIEGTPLTTLFSSRKTKEDIKKELFEKFGIPIDAEFGKEIDTMCNLSDMFEERGIARGMARGREEGELKEKRAFAVELYRHNVALDIIVAASRTTEAQVKQWLKEEGYIKAIE